MARNSPTAVLWSALAAGGLFGFGLALSTMVKPERILDFLLLHDLGLLLVMGGAAGVTFIVYRLAPRVMKKPLFAAAFGKHPSHLNWRTLVGAAIFGVGWGLSGVCPGPAVAGLGVGNWPLLASVAGILIGAWVEGRFFGRHH